MCIWRWFLWHAAVASAVCLLASGRRSLGQLQLQTWESGEEAIQYAPELGKEAPQLPRKLAKRFSLGSFLASGGQAEVWTGTDRTDGKAVVLRFPKALCELKWCRVQDIDEITLDGLWQSCDLANMAADRHYARLAEDTAEDTPYGSAFWTSVQSRNPASRFSNLPFSECLVPLSHEGSDVAVEVWTHVGDATLAEGFFLGVKTGQLTIEQKRQILEELWDAVRTLADQDIGGSRTCCCRREHRHRRCTLVAPENETQSLIPRLVRKVRRRQPGPCPNGYEEAPDACGPIVHHDIKFDNIVLRGPSSHTPVAAIIDFGSASSCSSLQSDSYTPDWVPYWLQETPEAFPRGNCWSYDTFGLGLAWLVVELLKDLDPGKLLCDAAVRSGLVDASTMISNGTHYTCGKYPIDFRLTQLALEPVNVLVHNLRRQVLKPENLQTQDDFESSIEEFVSKTKVAKDSLSVSNPDDHLLLSILFPMLRECPAYPRSARRPRHPEDERSDHEAVLRCRFQKASRDLHEAMKQGNKEIIANHVEIIDSICLALRMHIMGVPMDLGAAFIIEDVDSEALADLQKRCLGDRTAALWNQVRMGDADAMQLHFDHLEEVSSDGVTLANSVGDDGESLLAAAARARSVPMVEFLLDHGADPIKKGLAASPLVVLNNSFGGLATILPLTPLLAAACMPNNEDVLSLLLKALPGPLQLDDLHVSTDLSCRGPSLLSLVAESGDVRMLSLVVDALRPHLLTDVLNGLHDGHVPLLRAARRGRAACCAFLFDINADVAKVDPLGRHALMLAVISGSIDTAKIIGSRFPAEVNRKVASRGAALHVAVRQDDAEMVSLLLDLRADATQKDEKGRTPLDVAVFQSSSKVVASLASVVDA